eukprot:TRINITY_DN5539_c0_g1_i1.p1 TRINITY_DN5539_c0_g1~~TRINITY_DN5539_c0_g1_i1.p1  ORF type:complete len:482 (-),score=77.81 TRINITY_DN5539_c0_g1_i1:632-2077(-)
MAADLNTIDAAQKVWVGGLGGATTEDLLVHFSMLGNPIGCQVLRPGLGCVAYATPDEAAIAVSAFNGSQIAGSTIQTDSWSAKQHTVTKGKGMNAGKGAMGKGGMNAGMGGYSHDQLLSSLLTIMGAQGFNMGQQMGGQGKGGSQWGGKGGGQWGGSAKWADTSWQAPAGPPAQVYWVTVPPTSALVLNGLPTTGPAVIYEKGKELFECATLILREIVGDLTTQVQLLHDPDWEQFPEIGPVLKQATGEEECFGVAYCPQRGVWGIGVASGWKNRESACRLALSIALAKQDAAVASAISARYPQFGKVLQKSNTAKAAPALEDDMETVPPIRFITLQGESKITTLGLPAQAPSVEHQGKHMKKYFDNADAILRDLMALDVAFEDDPEWTSLPEVGQALQAAGADDNCYCVASCASQACWGTGIGAGWKARESSAKLALALAIAQQTGRLHELTQKYPEFHEMCANAGLVAGPAKRRKVGGW